MPTQKITLNARLINPIEVTLGVPVLEKSVNCETITLSDSNGQNVPIEPTVLDEQKGELSIRLTEFVPPGNYDLSISESIVAAEQRPAFGGVNIGLFRAAT